jgi:hypothetical protein
VESDEVQPIAKGHGVTPKPHRSAEPRLSQGWCPAKCAKK